MRWYLLVVIVLTMVANFHNPVGLLYVLPINLLIFYAPVWLVVKALRKSKSPTDTVSPPS